MARRNGLRRLIADSWLAVLSLGLIAVVCPRPARSLSQGLGLEVQLKLLKSRALRHPYYWASFVALGEWASLPIQ